MELEDMILLESEKLVSASTGPRRYRHDRTMLAGFPKGRIWQTCCHDGC